MVVVTLMIEGRSVTCAGPSTVIRTLVTVIDSDLLGLLDGARDAVKVGVAVLNVLHVPPVRRISEGPRSVSRSSDAL